jgi:hypothetical protein
LIKKSTFLHVLPNAYAILKSDDFKNTIFKNAIFKIALIEIALPNGPLLEFNINKTQNYEYLKKILWL